ncbi:hypothetical protein T310_6050, partial [Rasamsonia emersonii CBS 393.64]
VYVCFLVGFGLPRRLFWSIYKSPPSFRVGGRYMRCLTGYCTSWEGEKSGGTYFLHIHYGGLRVSGWMMDGCCTYIHIGMFSQPNDVMRNNHQSIALVVDRSS